MSRTLSEPKSDTRFEDLNLSGPIIEAIRTAGYETATPIQARAIPVLLAGRDLLGQAQTGTGKTAAFAFPMLQKIDLDQARPQVLVLTPTRELAIQVAEAFRRYAANLTGLRVVPIYGGQDYRVQFRQLDRGVHVVVGTPGRVMDHMNRGSLKLDGLRGLVLDEADEMLQMGFADDVEWVLSRAPAQRQVALFSATLPEPIRRLAKRHLRNPAEITITQKSATPDAVRQRFVAVEPHEKRDVLARILKSEPIDAVLVFVNTKNATEPLADYLSAQGHRAAALSGDVPQSGRERIVEALRGKLDVIVATDVAARGLDVQRISHVINFDLPLDTESYIHRIGRTGRASRTGNAILFVHPRGRHTLKRIEHATAQIDRADGNSHDRRHQPADDRTLSRADHGRPGATRPRGFLKRRGNLSPRARCARSNASQRCWRPSPRAIRPCWSPTSGRSPASTRIAILTRGVRVHVGAMRANAGMRARAAGARVAKTMRRVGTNRKVPHRGRPHPQVKPTNIVGAIANETGLHSRFIGRIEIFDEHSTVDLLTGMPPEMFQKLKNVKISGRRLDISRLGQPSDSEERPGLVANEVTATVERPSHKTVDARPVDERPFHKHHPVRAPSEIGNATRNFGASKNWVRSAPSARRVR